MTPPGRRILVAGKVQGVAFRAFLAQEALRLGLVGWVRNRTDGTVEAAAWGPDRALDALCAWCQRGSPAARVAEVCVEAMAAIHVPSDFSILPDALV